MTSVDSSVSPSARLADPEEGISVDELRLAARNHGMPLEALAQDLTPVGLHYVLTHYDIPWPDPATWRLRIDGHVDHPLTLDLSELRERHQLTHRVTLECAGNGRAHLSPRPVSQPWLDEAVGTAEWTGTPLRALLAEAGVREGAVDVAFTGADHGVERGVEQDYSRGLTLTEALGQDVLLAHAMNGAPLPPQHGAPLRLIVPGWYGMAQVKWLTHIEVLTEAFQGFQNASAYRIQHEPGADGEPVTRIRPRALLRPPGFPDFQTRTRVVERGTHELRGRAWSGSAPITDVQVSVDGGRSWAAAELEPAHHPHAWRGWRWTWRAHDPGDYVLCARACDATGDGQPMDQPWNRQGMANNEAQRVPVLVR